MLVQFISPVRWFRVGSVVHTSQSHFTGPAARGTGQEHSPGPSVDRVLFTCLALCGSASLPLRTGAALEPLHRLAFFFLQAKVA
jgi:hypothetical protein